jgi:hypothetical protein
MQSTPRVQSTLTAKAAWYLCCFETLSGHLKRSPSIDEFSAYVRKDVSTCWRHLNRLAGDEYLRKTKPRGGRFVVVSRNSESRKNKTLEGWVEGGYKWSDDKNRADQRAERMRSSRSA